LRKNGDQSRVGPSKREEDSLTTIVIKQGTIRPERGEAWAFERGEEIRVPTVFLRGGKRGKSQCRSQNTEPEA